MRYKFKILLGLILLFCALRLSLYASADANDDKILELRKKIAELTAQAEQYRKTALQKHQQADTLKRQLDILNNQILSLQKQIEATERNISMTKIEINDRQERIYTAAKKIEQEHGWTQESRLGSSKKNDQTGFTV